MVELTDAKCAICLDMWKKPKVTPTCSHIFCSTCLETLILRQFEESAEVRDDRTFECPLCRRVNFLPPGGIHQLQVNAFLDDYATKLRAQLEIQVSAQQPEIISSDNIVKKQGVSDVKSGHVVEQDDTNNQCMEVGPRLIFCLDHYKVPPFGTQAPPAKAYCYECNRLVCLDCHDEFHGLHCVTKVEEALKLKSSKCEDLLEDVRQLIPSFEWASEHGQTQVATFCEQTESAIEKVAANLEDIVRRLNVIKGHFVTYVQRAAMGQTMQVHNSLKNCSYLLERAKLLEKQLCDALANEDLLEMVIKLRLFEQEALELHQATPGESELDSQSNPMELDFSECFAHMQMFTGAATALLDNFPLIFGPLPTPRNNMRLERERKYDRQTLLNYRLSPFVQLESHLYDTLCNLGIFNMPSTLPFARSLSEPQSMNSSDDESSVRYSSLPPYLSVDEEHGAEV